MRYFKIIWKNCVRNRRRTLLTILSIAFSLFLVSFLRTLVIELTRVNETPTSIRRAIVRRSTSLAETLPESYKGRMESVPSVELVLAENWFGGIYKEPKNFFANFAADHDTIFQVYPEMKLDDQARQAFLTQRSAALCGAKLAERFGWKVGEKITLLGSIYPVALEFTLVGFYTSKVEEITFFFRRDYFEESLGKPGLVQSFELRPQLRITEGRTFRPGFREMIISKNIAARFKYSGVGERLKFGKGMWTVVGHFEAGGMAFDSEMWADVNELTGEFGRPGFSSFLLRSRDPRTRDEMIRQLNSDRRLQVEALPEREYYDKQTFAAIGIQTLATLMTIFMGIGACFAAMNTMYTAVTNRTREIGALRALGFSRGEHSFLLLD